MDRSMPHHSIDILNGSFRGIQVSFALFLSIRMKVDAFSRLGALRQAGICECYRWSPYVMPDIVCNSSCHVQGARITKAKASFFTTIKRTQRKCPTVPSLSFLCFSSSEIKRRRLRRLALYQLAVYVTGYKGLSMFAYRKNRRNRYTLHMLYRAQKSFA